MAHEPVCQCDPGAIPVGLRCFSCDPLSELALDVRVAQAFPKVNGVAPPKVGIHSGDIYLADPATGDRVLMGATHEDVVSARVVSSIYEVLYSVTANSAESPLPNNTNAKVRRIGMDQGGTTGFFIFDVPSTEITVTFTVNGASPPSSGDQGNVYLRNRETGDEIALGSTSATSVTTKVVDEAYDVFYEATVVGDTMPANHRALVGGMMVMASEVTLVDIPVVHVTGSFQFNDMPAPANGLDVGRVYLRDRNTEDEITLGETSAPGYELNLLPGEYDVMYENLASSGIAPRNRRAIVGELILEAGDSSVVFPINIASVPVSGDFTIEGAPPPASASDDGVITLESEMYGVLSLGNTREQSFALAAIPGTYEAYYSQETSGAVAPANTHARIADVVAVDGNPLALDVDVIEVSGDFSLGGLPVVSDVLEDARVLLENAETGDTVLLGRLSEQSFDRRIVPGDYTLRYAIEAGGEVVPANANAHFGEVSWQADALEPVDVPFSDLLVPVTFNGIAPPVGSNDHGYFYLVDRVTGDEVFFGDSVEGTLSRRVLPGDYLLRYRYAGVVDPDTDPSEVRAPRNSDIVLRCVHVE